MSEISPAPLGKGIIYVGDTFAIYGHRSQIPIADNIRANPEHVRPLFITPRVYCAAATTHVLRLQSTPHRSQHSAVRYHHVYVYNGLNSRRVQLEVSPIVPRMAGLHERRDSKGMGTRLPPRRVTSLLSRYLVVKAIVESGPCQDTLFCRTVWLSPRHARTDGLSNGPLNERVKCETLRRPGGSKRHHFRPVQ